MQTIANVIRRRGHELHTLHTSASMQEAAQSFLDHNAALLLVVDGARQVGIFTRNDLLRQLTQHPKRFSALTAGESARADFVRASLNDRLIDVLRQMVARGIHNVPVLDGDQPLGLITAADVVLARREDLQVRDDELLDYMYEPAAKDTPHRPGG